MKKMIVEVLCQTGATCGIECQSLTANVPRKEEGTLRGEAAALLPVSAQKTTVAIDSSGKRYAFRPVILWAKMHIALYGLTYRRSFFSFADTGMIT